MSSGGCGGRPRRRRPATRQRCPMQTCAPSVQRLLHWSPACLLQCSATHLLGMKHGIMVCAQFHPLAEVAM